MPRMWDSYSRPKPRAGCEGQARRLRDLAEREGVELRRDLAQEPGRIVLLRVLFRPLPVKPMVRGVGLAAFRIRRRPCARVCALADLCCFRSRADRLIRALPVGRTTFPGGRLPKQNTTGTAHTQQSFDECAPEQRASRPRSQRTNLVY
jgi:hypothetical protein